MIGNILDVVVILLTGLVVLGGLAWLIGRVEADARDGAWQRIADARRRLHDQEQDLLLCFTGSRCADCPVGHYLRDHQRG
jgi:hypothetical protein